MRQKQNKLDRCCDEAKAFHQRDTSHRRLFGTRSRHTRLDRILFHVSAAQTETMLSCRSHATPCTHDRQGTWSQCAVGVAGLDAQSPQSARWESELSVTALNGHGTIGWSSIVGLRTSIFIKIFVPAAARRPCNLTSTSLAVPMRRARSTVRTIVWPEL